MSKPISLFLRRDGYIFQSSLHKDVVRPIGEYPSISPLLHFSMFHRPVTVVAEEFITYSDSNQQDFIAAHKSDSSLTTPLIEDMELPLLKEVLGANLTNVIPSSSAISSLVQKESKLTTFIAITFIDDRVKVVGTLDGVVHMQTTIAAQKHTESLSALVKRVVRWWNTEIKTTLPSLILLGSYKGEVGSEITHILPEITGEMCISAGGILENSESSFYYKTGGVKSFIRSSRLAFTIIALITFVTTSIMSIYTISEKSKISEEMKQIASFDNTTLDSAVSSTKKILEDEWVYIDRMKNSISWAELLHHFASLVPKAVTVNSFSSREQDGKRVISLDGIGKREPAISQLVESMKQSTILSDVSLTSLEQSKNRTYRFRITCTR